MTKFVALVSGKGGTGKTTVCINLAAALKSYGRDVIILDGDLHGPNINIHLGLPSVPVTLNDVISSGGDITNAIYKHHTGVKIIPASISLKDYPSIDYKLLHKAYNDLKGLCEIVFVDCPPGFSEGMFDMINGMDELIVVTNPDLPSLTDTLRLIKILDSKGHNIIGVIVNMCGQSKDDVSTDNVETLLDKPVIGEIPYDVKVRSAIKKKIPVVMVHTESKSAKAFRTLAQLMIGHKTSLK